MNVLWIVVDCLRHDALSANGYHRPTTEPLDDRLTNEFVAFDDAATQSAFTLNVITSLVTGTYPSTHGVLRWHDRYDGDPSPYREYTGTDLGPVKAVPAMNFMTEEWGLDRAFDTVHDLDAAKRARESNTAITEEVFDTARDVMAERDPFNLFCWLFDLHTPWLSEPAFGDGTPRDRYDTELRYVADELESLFTHLERSGQYDDTLVILTGDHGEVFDEYQYLPWHPLTEVAARVPGLGQSLRGTHLGHLGRPLVDELVHVPLYVKLPNGAHGGETVTGQVELIDVLPTVLDVAGETVPPAIEGESLRPHIRGEADGKKFVRAEVEPNPTDGLFRMIRSSDRKFLHHDRPSVGDISSGFDVARYIADAISPHVKFYWTGKTNTRTYSRTNPVLPTSSAECSTDGQTPTNEQPVNSPNRNDRIWKTLDTSDRSPTRPRRGDRNKGPTT